MHRPVYVTAFLSAACALVCLQGLQAAGLNGMGTSSYVCVDRDGDGYGTGPIQLGPYTDLAIDKLDKTKVTSASHTFGSSDVGRVITITGGTGFTQGWFLITAVSAGVATLQQPAGWAAGAGTLGSTGGAWVIYGCIGPDADDLDASIHTAADAMAAYGTMQKFLAHRGYTPLRIWLLDATGSSTATYCTPATFESACLAAPRSTMPSSIAAGDLIMVRANQNLRMDFTGLGANGTSTNPIVVMGYPGEVPNIVNTGGSQGILMNGRSWFIVDGIQSISITAGDSNYSQTPHPFHDNIFRHIYGGPNGYEGLGPMAGGNNITIEDSVFANNNYGSGQAGLYIGCTYTACSNWTVQRNIAYNNAWDGLHWNGIGSGLVWKQNISHSNNIAGFSFQSGMTNSTVTANLSFNNSSYPMLLYQYKDNDSSCGTAPCGTGPSTGNVFESNTLVDLTNSSYLGASYSNAANGCFSVANHTPVNSYTNGPYFDMGSNTWRNNICLNWGDSSTTYRYAPLYFEGTPGTKYFATSTFDHNLTKQMNGVNGGNGVFGVGPLGVGGQSAETVYDCTTAKTLLTTGSITNCVSADPQFVSAQRTYFPTPALYDFHLQATSPAIQAGTTTGLPAYDLFGNSFASTPAIGAVEFTGATPTPSPTPPVVSFAAPAAGATVSGTVAASASVTVSGTRSVAGVQVQVDGSALGAAALSGSVYTLNWDTTKYANGSHTLTVVATDNAGATGTASVSVTVSNTLSAQSTGPVISGISAQSITASGATIVWTTDKASDSQVVYGATTAYGLSSALASTAVTAHSVALAGLSASTTYYYKVLSRDALGNLTTSAGSSFATAAAASSGATGWVDLPNTQLKSACPANNFGGISYAFNDKCGAVITAWSGAVADTKRNRLIIWGGGHVDYSGNEVYSLNVGTASPTLTRLTDPSDFTKNTGCPDSNVVDGTPVSRHTYGGLVYLPVQDRLFTLGGSPAPCGGFTGRTYTLDLSTATPTWHAMDPVNGFNPATAYWSGQAICAYDANTQSVICAIGGYFLRYDPSTNTYTQLSTSQHVPYAGTGVIDPKRKLFIFMGHEYQSTAARVIAVDLSSTSKFVAQDWSAQVTGCDALASASYPGLVYDPVLDRIVGWPDSGNTIYVLDTDQKTCSAQTFANGPTNTLASTAGTFGRFQYFPALNSYFVLSLATLDAYKLNLSTANAPPASNPCDVNNDGLVDANDVKSAINQAIGSAACGSAALALPGICDVVDVQRVITAALGGACRTGQ